MNANDTSNPNEFVVVLGAEHEASDAAVLSAILGNDAVADPLQIALAALDGLGRDLVMLSIAEAAEGGPSEELRERYLMTLHTRANGAAEAIRRLARKSVPSPKPETDPSARTVDVPLAWLDGMLTKIGRIESTLAVSSPESSDEARTTELQRMHAKLVELEAKVAARTAMTPVYPDQLREAVQAALVDAAAARGILPNDEPDMRRARAQLDDAVDQLGSAVAIMAEEDGAA